MSQSDLSVITAGVIAPDPGGVRGAIARAAQATGVDFGYLLAQARLESSLDPTAHAATSSAAGLYQFTKGTWSTMLARHGAALDPGVRALSVDLRYDANAAAMMAAQLAGDNTAALGATLGRAPTSSELYLAHFLGAAGATRFLGALAGNPDQSAAALLPKAAAANPAVFYDVSGGARSLGAVMALIETRMATAMQDTGGNEPAPGFAQIAASPIASQFSAAQATVMPAIPASDAGTTTRTSMADTLRTTFALSGDGAGPGAAPAFVRSAYGQMQALGL